MDKHLIANLLHFISASEFKLHNFKSTTSKLNKQNLTDKIESRSQKQIRSENRNGKGGKPRRTITKEDHMISEN